MDNKYSRRKFIEKTLYAGTAFLGGAWLISSSCKAMKPAVDPDTAQVPAQDTVKPLPKNVQAPAAQDTAKAVAKGKEAVHPCDDLTGVSASEIDKRKKLAYVNKSPLPDSHCSNCALYLPPAAGKPCGGCMLFKGPVRAEGYCTYWAPVNN